MKRVLELWVLAVLISSPAFANDPVVAQGDKLQPGDVLQVNVWKETELQSEVLIRPDGGILASTPACSPSPAMPT